MIYTFTFQESHYHQLRNHLLRNDNRERAAFIVCGISSVEGVEERYLSREIVTLADADLITSQQYQVSFNNNPFIKVLKEAEKKGFSVALIHNHPSNFKQFSATDDEGEQGLFQLAFNRNSSRKAYPSLILMPDGSLVGRVWNEYLETKPLSKFRIYGQRMVFDYPNKLEGYESSNAFQRQSLAFGNSLNQDLSNIKVTIVGSGATGSATALLLARLGVRELTLIDSDVVEETNLNRLHGATKQDIGLPKVDVLKKEIDRIGIGTKVHAIRSWVSSREAINELKSSDLIFGCTDDHAGRIMINRFAYFYLTPVIDMGLVISISENIEGDSEIRNLQGRISYLFPGGDCLITKHIINQDIAYAENLKRDQPDTYKTLKEEAYVIGEGNPAPSIGTFTTQIAAMAVNSFLNRLVGYNKMDLSPHKIYFFHRNTEIVPGNVDNNDCRICGSDNYWGRGDMQPFLDMVL